MSNLWVLPNELGDVADDQYAAEAAQVASQILWAMSGRKFQGITTVTERYVRTSDRYFGIDNGTVTPILMSGEMYNVSTDFTDGVPRVKLRGNPVNSIESIYDARGVLIPDDNYELVDHSTIQFFPGAIQSNNNLEITYSYGRPVPLAGKMAARTLAIELSKGWRGDDDCALPQRVTSVTRQGVTWTILDSQDFIDDLRTGLYLVDLFLKSVNPDKARSRARVFSVDVPRARRLPRS